MKVPILIILISISLQACNNNDAEIQDGKLDVEENKIFYNECIEKNGIFCEIPLEVAYSQEYLGKTVKLKGVLIAIDDVWGRADKPKRFRLYSSPSAVEVCADSSSIGIIPQNMDVYSKLLKYDGYIVDINGVLDGSQHPFTRTIEIESFSENVQKPEGNLGMRLCGKIPPPPPLPPSPLGQGNK